MIADPYFKCFLRNIYNLRSPPESDQATRHKKIVLAHRNGRATKDSIFAHISLPRKGILKQRLVAPRLERKLGARQTKNGIIVRATCCFDKYHSLLGLPLQTLSQQHLAETASLSTIDRLWNRFDVLDLCGLRIGDTKEIALPKHH